MSIKPVTIRHQTSSLRVKGGGLVDDEKIIGLYFSRDEAAISESRAKYGAYCETIANNILHSREDSEECVSDALLRAWDSIPPNRPVKLAVYLGRIVRNLAIDMWRRLHRAKNGGGEITLCLDELAECVSAGEEFSEDIDLRDMINRFLDGLKPDSRRLFMLRYWYMLPIREAAVRCGISEGAAKMSLMRTRSALREFLFREGYEV